MPIMRLKEIRDLPQQDRDKKLGELRTEFLRLQTMIRAGGTIENPARVKQLRKTIARLLTVENEDRLGISKKKKTSERRKKKK
jgi:large subunit ribosomal protein L29